ncbi:GTP cyclohydrolase [Rhizobium sp. KVB221]|uniref:GTP cyclohydrolase n=1 Tax=Rhizobium setariae TaxID=2801340 RepID=A0A937CK26_9HYPH|nr:YciI family protein [Rhizobium setariae]MBL0371720.1 GTP cyclohydrolase [Rhizobium setariae]
MLILSLTYTTEIEKADAFMEAHMTWVKRGYDEGWFVASGRKVPRTGGIILARGDRIEIEEFCESDPFVVNSIGQYEFFECAFTSTAEGFENLQA